MKSIQITELPVGRVRALLRRYRDDAVGGLVKGACTAVGGALVTGVILWFQNR
ncbi:hypothetical protein ABZ921_35370 [Streptomyces atriruber]|uniref:Uncharacterized protein n=1 Tax=Streptomyces atriruber TaxID=545121 RepID=A0ABV3BY22_9ACTN